MNTVSEGRSLGLRMLAAGLICCGALTATAASAAADQTAVGADLGASIATAAIAAIAAEPQCAVAPPTPLSTAPCRAAVASAIQGALVQGGAAPTIALVGLDRAAATVTQRGLYTLPVELAFTDLRGLVVAQSICTNYTGAPSADPNQLSCAELRPAAIGSGAPPTIGAPPLGGFSGGQGSGAIYGTPR